MRRSMPLCAFVGLCGGTQVLRNFFPMGLRSGPKNAAVLAPINNFDPRQANNIPRLPSNGTGQKRLNFVTSRNDLKLKCECCQFQWLFDTLTVRCSAHPTVHNQQEVWLQPTWMYERQQPRNWFHYLNVNRNPRTGQLWSRETSKGMNCERRAMGLTSYMRRVEREKRQIPRQVSGVGTYSNRWKTRFPFPS